MAKSYTLHKIHGVDIHEGGWFAPYPPHNAVLVSCYSGNDPEHMAVEALRILGEQNGSVELAETGSDGTARIMEIEIVDGRMRNIYDYVYREGKMTWQKR